MNSILNKYSTKGSFEFLKNETLAKKCNAPKDNVGVYLVYDAKSNLIYIGCSGWLNQDGTLGMREGGMFDRIVDGKQFNKPRRKSWAKKMNEQNIDKIKVEWYVTFDKKISDIPAYVESILLQMFFNKQKVLPIWNKCF